MKTITGIIALMLLVSNISLATGMKRKASNDREKVDTINVIAKVPFVPNATIFTPVSVIDNDELIVKRYRGYTLYNLENEKVLRVNPTLHESAKLSLKAGDYIVKLNGQKRQVYRISVLENQYNEFVIE